MTHYENVTITVKNDDEGFLGSDPEAIAKIDVDRSVQNYNSELRGDLRHAFPGAEIILEYGPYSGRSVIVEIDWENVQKINTDDVNDEIQEIVGRIYNNGTFWTEK